MASDDEQQRQQASVNAKLYGKTFTCKTTEAERNIKKEKSSKKKKILVKKKKRPRDGNIQASDKGGRGAGGRTPDRNASQEDSEQYSLAEYYDTDDVMSEYSEMTEGDDRMEKNLSYMTPQMLHALKMSQAQSQLEYQREMKNLQGKYNLDECLPKLPEVEMAKKARLLASKLLDKSLLFVTTKIYEKFNLLFYNNYKKGMSGVLSQYKGFQKISPADNPETKQGIQTAALLSNKKYKEDWDYDKGIVCFPATLTPSYDTLVAAQRNASQKAYKQDLEKTLGNIHYDPTKTDLYKCIQDNWKYSNDKSYRAAYEKNKSKYTPLPFTPQMLLSKTLYNTLNWNAYTAYARKLWEHYHLVVPIPVITQAVQTAKMTSDKWYKADFKKECIGKSGPADIAFYPELEQARKAAGFASKVEYRKAADKAKQICTIPADHPDFLRAKTAADQSDIKYKKQKAQTIAEFQGYQRMDASQHPVVQNAAKAAELQSDKNYREDWEYDKQMIYYPAHITPAYEAAADVRKVQSDAQYRKAFDRSKAKNNYDVTNTQRYEELKAVGNVTSDNKYKEEYRKNQGNVIQVPETTEMSRAKELQPVLSKKAYTEKSKDDHKNVNIGSDLQEISHAVGKQKQASTNAYKSDYKQHMVGRAPADPTSAYPEHELHRKVTKLASKPEYVKESEKLLRKNHLPVDAPEFIRAKQAALQASDIEYQKQKYQTVADYRGYQTMDAQDHPVVQRAAAAAEISSDKAYKEDWEYDKQMIYYPVHITPAYEAAADVMKVQSDTSYKKEFEKTKAKNEFRPTDTERYKEMKQVENVSSDVKYKEAYEKNKGKGATPVSETHEMALAKQLLPVLSKKQYREKSKNMQKNVNVKSDIQEISHAVSSQQLASPHSYTKEYKESIVGQGPSDPTVAYPEHDLHRKATNLASSTEYHKDAARMMTQHHLPADAPEFVRAKEAAKNASDREYQKQRKETIDNYKGFQTMDSSDHPVVQRGIKAAELASDTAYREDWEYDKQMIYYPVHITPAYEAAADVRKIQSDKSYKKEFEKTKAKNEFRPTDTERYKEMKQVENVSSDVKYKEAYEKNKGKGATPVSETHEMALAKQLLPVLSKKQYSEKAKNMQKNVNVKSDIQEISHAVSSQQLASPHPYTKEYKESIVGQGPSDPTVAYPEHDLHRKATNLASSTEYHKDAARMMTQHHLPVDAPEFVRAKEAAKNASDREYQKQRKETIDNYKGFQTMDSSDHPVVQRGIKAAELASDTAYREDWEYDKQMIYYPVHITPAYEAAADVRKIQSDTSYKKEFEKTKAKNEFRPTDTERYKEMKQVENVSSDVKYKEAYEKNKGKGATPVPETHEMALAKQLLPVLSKKQYSEKAKNMQKNVNVKSDIQEISHAVSSQQLASPHPYTKEYKESIVGQGPSDPTVAYPEHDLHRKATNLASSTEYHKDAARMMTQHHLPVDAPEFVRAKEAAKNASDREYQKQRKETIDNYKGFQTMDSSDHPVVQRGIKAAELASDKNYREDWEYDKQVIYYPVHLTPAYEAAADVRKIQSDVGYKQDFEAHKAMNDFRPTDTEQYKDMKRHNLVSSDVKYKEEYEKNKGQGHSEIPETHEMTLAKELKPVQSKKMYTEKSKKMHKNVNIGPDVQEISHAVNAQKLSSEQPYLAEYKQSMVGKGRSDPANAYPEVKHHKELAKLASQTEYQKEAEKIKHHHNIPLDYPEFVRAKEAAKNASDIEYQKQRKETIDNYKGFQTMDSSEHPVVQRGIKAAELASDSAYREDWEYDKQMIYYPVHITPAYEAAVDIRKVQSDSTYKGEFEKNKDKNKFNVTDTERYKAMKEIDKASSDVAYREAYEQNRGKGFSQIPETREMKLSKNLKPIQSTKLYTEKSKEMRNNFTVGPEGQDISHALSAQKLSSDQNYKADYEKNMLGKRPDDVVNSYPEYEHLRKVAQQASTIEYHKDAEKILHHHNLPLDYPEFVRAKETAKNASDMHYKKQRKEVIDAYRGFQTMDSKDHPVVKQGIKAAELASDSAYREDWEYDKQLIYYPVHITPAYEAAVDIRKVQSDNKYKEDYEKTKDKNKFLATDTTQYKALKDTEKMSSDVKYKEEYEKNKGQGHSEIPETHEMTLAKALKPVQSKKMYTEKSKKMHKNVNIGPDVQEIALALSTQKLASDVKYHADYEKDLLGKAPADTTQAYPEYERLREVSKMLSKAEYEKEAEKIKHHHNIPLDYPEFIRAKEAAKNASDIEYQKQRKETIDNYKGFQTMDSSDHPVVQRGIKAAELASDKLYREDWEYEKNLIYYPVHITPGYEHALEASKFQSLTGYTKDAEKDAQKNQFKPTDTEHYQTAQKLLKLVAGKNYTAEYLENRDKDFHPPAKTFEMAISDSLTPLLSNKCYTEKAKKIMQKYNLDSSTQGIAHALSAQNNFSPGGYVDDFKKSIVGKAPSDLVNSYPEYDLARNMTKLSSKIDYVKEADKMMHTHHIPHDYPEFVRAKENAKNASDIEYKKQRGEVIEKYRGFQTMDSQEHPIVQQGIKAAALISNQAYKEDWEYDKALIYYPAHITPGYEAAVQASKVQSDASYKKEHEASKSSNKFNVTDTDHYKTSKDLDDRFSERKYREAYEAEKGKKGARVTETPEMKISKSVGPLLSVKLYGDDARRKMQEYNLDTSMQAINRALAVQKVASTTNYLNDFKKTMLGKAPADLANSYPEYEHARKISKLSSKTEYHRDAEKKMHTHNIPIDYPEFVRAKENAKNASDIEYKKQRGDVISNYRGFQTMDSQDHPVVQHGIRVADLISDRKYKEDYMADKDLIYYPVHLTAGYEAAVKSSEMQSDVKYKKESAKELPKNKYLYSETDLYKTQKNIGELRDRMYKGEYPRQFTAVKRTPEMDASNMVRWLLSNSAYTKEAKKRMDVYNVDLNDQRLLHARRATQLSSDQKYREEFLKEIKGKTPADVTISHPEYDHAKQVSKLISKTDYVKDAEKIKHMHHLPVDYPEFVRARECAKNASDIEYQKQRQPTIDQYRGFQTMDSKDHPVVQHGIKAADLSSHRKYIEDYLVDRNIIYYPVHLTPGYEAAIKASQYQSELKYRENSKKSAEEVRFDPTQTDQYKTAKETQQLVNDKTYNEEGRKKLATEFTPEAETSEMLRARKLKPLAPYEYQKKAKDVLHKYHLNVELPEITHALCLSQLLSKNNYLKEYNETVKGAAPSDLANSYPEYIHARNVSNQNSKSAYTKDGEQTLHHFTMPVDTLELNRAKESAKNASDLLYKKQRKEVIDAYRGFQTMDSKDHPVVKQGLKAAELMSERKYKEDYMADKDLIYYPVHLTAGYEAAVKSSEIRSDTKYKAKHEAEKQSNRFDPVQTQTYETGKAASELLKDRVYQNALQDLSKDVTVVADSISHEHNKAMKDLMSNKLYTENAKKALDKYNINSDVIQIAHALLSTPLLSDVQYRKAFMKEVKGKGISGAGLDFYPDYVKALENTKLSSKNEYSKENEKVIHHYTMPLDTPELSRAKESAINASDLHYKKQRKETIDAFRGFQTMDSKDHPVVQHGIKAADLISDRKYKEDYMADKDLIYYPVHLTAGYEAATKASQYIHGPNYQKAYKRDRDKVRFDVTQTEAYKGHQDQHKFADVRYKVDPASLPFTQVADGPDMVLAKTLKPLVSYWFYKDQAKKMLDKYHIDVADQRMVHALHANDLYSEKKYKDQWEKEIKGKMSNDNLDSYPEYIHAMKTAKNVSQIEYGKGLKKHRNEYTIPPDMPSIKLAKDADKMISANEYGKQLKQTIDGYRGFQTMDSKHHPVVQRGIKAADLISERKYKEDYLAERNLIYYPFHLTSVYETAIKASKFTSEADYKKWFNDNIRGRGNFQVHLAPGYEQAKQLKPFQSDRLYRQKYEETKSEFTPIVDGHDMKHVKVVQPWLSQKKYKQEARKLMGKYHLDVEVPEIAHALFVSSLSSPFEYKKLYENEMKGVGAKNLEKSPYMEQLLKASKLASKVDYGKTSDEGKNLYTLDIETTDIKQALLADKLTSDLEYKKGAKEALSSCQGYHKLGVDDLPRYKKLREIGQNTSDVKYKEEYNDMKKYVYFPYHITPEYEKHSDASKFLSPAFYTKGLKENLGKQNFKYHEIPAYAANKELQALMSVARLQKEREEMLALGYHMPVDDVTNEHVKEVQKRISSNLYKAAARDVMDKYNITADLPQIKQAVIANKLASDNVYKDEYNHEKGTGMDYAPDIPIFKHARNVRSLTSDKSYKDEAHQALHQYAVVPDTPNLIQAKIASQQQSDVEYKRKGKDESAKCKAYQHLRASEQRDVAHARKVNDIISPSKYKEEYNEIRNIIYFPVHLTDGYESALKANKFASPANYKKGWMDSRYKNNFRVHETEGYQLERAIQKKISDIGYKADYKKSVGKCPYVTETMERAHHRNVKDMMSGKRYRQKADEIMDKYHLITDEPRMLHAIRAMDLFSDNKYKEEYEHEKGTWMSNSLETPQMRHALKMKKLTSEIPYKEAALNDLPKVHIPEDASAIKHASEAGKLVSEISYKKDAKENQLKGFNKIDVKDNYVLNHLNQIKDLPSEVHYKKDLYEQKGQAIPVVDTPENLRVAKQQKLQSDNIYKKDLEKLVKGRGLSTDRTPELQHAKEMTSLHSENKYKEGTKDQHEWKSGEAINTPTAVKAKETNQLTSDYKYKEKYEKSKGRGCDVITPAISHAKDAGKLVSENAYKEKFKKDSLIPAAYTVLPSTPQTEQAQKVAQKISDIKYKQEHLKEDIGLPSELKDSLLIRQNQKATDLQSNIEYKKQGELEAEAFKGYQKCLNETPQVLHAKKVKDILSDIKYKEVYENEKGIFFYPYFLTPQYETQVKAGKLQSQITYTKKAEEGRNDYHLSADQPNFKQAKLATELLSDLKYRQPHQGKAAKIRDARDVPSILHSKKMQDLFSDNLYRSNYEKIKDQYHLDVSTPTMINAKRAGKLLSDISYKKQHNKEKGKPFDSYNDSFQMKHLRSLPEMLSDLKYKQDLILSKGKVIQVDDTPWLTTFKQAQQFISDIKYGKEGSANLKTRFQPDKFNKHVKQVTENISDKKYHDDYETFFRGNLIPLPETPETRQVLQNSKLLSEAEYRQKAKEGLKKYLIIPDHPEFKRLRDVANYFSDLSYKDEAGKQRSKYTSVADTPVLRKAKENLELQSEVAYKGDAKAKLATDYALPEEGTRTMQQQRYATTLTSDKTYKDEGERIKHEPTAFRNLKATRETEHAKKVGKNFSQIKYSENAKKDLQHIHPVETDPWIEKAMETSDNISDIKYKAKDKDFLHNYRLKDADDFMKHAKNVRDNISDIKYKADYIDNIGLCWCLPDERRFEHARKVADLFSDNKYKQEAKKMKGKYHITTDTPEYERLRKVQADISEVKYKEGAPDRAKEFTILECTPDIQHAAAVSNLVSKNKYKEAFEKSKGRYTVLKDDSAITHATHVDKLISQNEYKKKAKSDRSKGFTLLADRPDTEHLKQVQRNVSNVEYRRKAKEAVDKNFTVLESTPDVQHAINTAKLQSNMHYKQKLEGKDTADLNTPAMKHAIGANRLQSELEYRKAFEKKVKGKGWKFIKDTPQQKHAEEIGKVQSQYKYTKKHRDSVGQVTSITDRPDILHAVSSNDMISDYEYKRRHRDMAGKGYTFTPDTPSQVHAEEATEFQSELRYRRKYGNKGKAWQAEESPFLDHYKDAQKLVDNVSYRKNAKEINSRGASIAMEETPSAAHCRKAQEILDSRRYKADFEKDVKGHGMTYDLHGTPAMDHVRRAEDIKSEKLYKEHYETNVKGRPTVAMDNPHIISAQKANHLISDVKYKQQYNESKGRAYAMAETPEMRRVRENQRTLSQVNYKSGSEMMKGKQTSVVLDTPELRRVRQNTVNCSKVLYKDKNLQGASFTVLDTPEFRTAKQNAKNFSQIKYQEDRDNMKGKVSSVVDDLTLRRVKQATLISSDLAYKGAKGRTEEMERMRSNIPRDSNTGKAPMTTNIDYKAQQSHVTSTSQSYPRYDVVRSEPVKRWRRNPGSIFDYDPSDYETDVEYEEGKRSGKAQVKSTDYAQSDVDEDYQRLLSIDPVTFKNQTKPWSEYLLGREYKHVAAPSSVPDYEATRQQRMNFNFVKGKYRALYDYAAADTDEITFRDGDVIVNVQPIDEGWMFGTCLRTGQTGMLPANYVELTA